MTDLKKISKIIKGELQGNSEYDISSVNSLHKAEKKDITFVVKEETNLDDVKAGALIVKKGSKIEYPNIIYVQDPLLAFAELMNFFYPHRKFSEGIDKNAYVSDTAEIKKNVSVGVFSYIGQNTRVGENTEIHAGVIIYNDVKIGKNCIIYSNVVVREHVEIGDNVIIQPGAVIGSDGFGFARMPDGTPKKIPQKGKLIIGNNCEIGANTCIDRSTIEKTELNEYIKTDNLVHIGHNVKIGKSTLIAAQTGIAGSTEIGENVIMGGQVGIADHLKIEDEVILAAKTGVTGNIKEKTIVAGYPHQEIKKWRRNYAIFRNLEKYIEKIKAIEKKIKELEEK